jgi:protein O-GlcNAc transferase
MTPPDAVNLLRQALNHHQRGQLEPAEALYRQVLAALPGNFDALRYLGTLLHQKGNNQEAVRLLKGALAAAPEGNPVVATVLNNLGEAMRAMGGAGVEASIPLYHKAISIQKSYPQARNNLASALATLGQVPQAIAELQGLVKESPSYFKGRLNLGNLFLIAGDFRSAREQLTAALQLAERPKSPFAATAKAGANPPVRPTELAAVHGGLATCAYKLGDLGAAVRSYETAIGLDPTSAMLQVNLGEALRMAGRSDGAEAALVKAVALDPKLPDARGKLGQVRAMRGDHRLGAEDVRMAAELSPADPTHLSNWLFEMQYLSGARPEEVLAEHRRWSDRFEKPLKRAAPSIVDPRADRQLRVGLLSGDFRAHPVMSFLAPLLAHHNRQDLTLVAYSDVQRPDEVTAALRKQVTEFYDVQALGDAQLAQRLISDRIDIAIDLAGHTGRNRLLALALRPCPIQMTWLGYPCTTGLSAIGYRVTDAVADPVGYEAHASEKLIRLAPCFLCYTPPVGAEAPEVNELPARATGHVTFGSFNNIAKLSDETLGLWKEVLVAVPGSRLVIKGIGLVEETSRQKVMERAVAAGLPGERLDLLPPTSTIRDHLASYHRIDIALDTSPYNGTTTTCEALFMGVPVVTLAGDRHVSRVGASLLAAAGRGEWVASDRAGYVRAVRQLSDDLSSLAAIRAELRGQMARSALCDGPAHTAGLTAALRDVWVAACAGR